MHSVHTEGHNWPSHVRSSSHALAHPREPAVERAPPSPRRTVHSPRMRLSAVAVSAAASLLSTTSDRAQVRRFSRELRLPARRVSSTCSTLETRSRLALAERSRVLHSSCSCFSGYAPRLFCYTLSLDRPSRMDAPPNGIPRPCLRSRLRKMGFDACLSSLHDVMSIPRHTHIIHLARTSLSLRGSRVWDACLFG